MFRAAPLLLAVALSASCAGSAAKRAAAHYPNAKRAIEVGRVYIGQPKGELVSLIRPDDIRAYGPYEILRVTTKGRGHSWCSVGRTRSLCFVLRNQQLMFVVRNMDAQCDFSGLFGFMLPLVKHSTRADRKELWAVVEALKALQKPGRTGTQR